MILTIESGNYEYLKDKSTYNHNYYKVKKGKAEIYEICHEDYDFYEYYLIENEQTIFLGCSNDCMQDTVVEIDFRLFYS